MDFFSFGHLLDESDLISYSESTMYLQIISARFLSHLLHFLAICLCFWSWQRNVDACNDSASNISYRNQLYAAYSLAIAFGVFELIPFFLGITSISIGRSIFVMFLHFSAAIGLVFFLFQHQCALRIWPIFALCSCVPMIIEFTVMIYKIVRQRV